jgi:hypothetical protein
MSVPRGRADPHALTSGGDSVAFVSVADAAADRARSASRGHGARAPARRRAPAPHRPRPRPARARGPRRRPALARAGPGRRRPSPRCCRRRRPTASPRCARPWRALGRRHVYAQAEEEDLLLGGVVQRARMQIGLFTVILTLTAAVIVMMVIYNLTLEKTHDLAVLKLMGAPRPRLLLGLVLQQAWLLGAIGYLVAYGHRPAGVPAVPSPRAHHRDHRGGRPARDLRPGDAVELARAPPRHAADRSRHRAGGLTMTDAVQAIGLSQDLRRRPGRGGRARRRQPHARARYGRGAAGPERVGQVDADQGARVRVARPTRRGALRRPHRGQGRRRARRSGGLRRQHLGFVFQKANLTSFLTARENVEIAGEFGGKLDGRRRARRAARLPRRARPRPRLPRDAQRRRAAAGRHRPRARQRAVADPGRRADRRARQRPQPRR